MPRCKLRRPPKKERHAQVARPWSSINQVHHDTRMLSVFKLFFRILMLMSPLVAMFNDADYKVAAQKAMAAYNSTTKKKGKKFKKRGRGGGLQDPLAELFGNEDASMWKEMELWLKANVSIVYFHRIRIDVVVF